MHLSEPLTPTRAPELSATPGGKRTADLSPTLGDLPDLLLVERARNRDARAFEALMYRYNRRLYRIARSILREPAAAEEAVQEAHLRAFTHLDRYEATGKFGAWLARLAFNDALAIRRRARPDTGSFEPPEPRSLEREPPAWDLSAAEPPIQPPAAALGVSDQALDAARTRELLEHALDSLPEVFRTVFVLRALEQLSGVETAACLGLNETTVRTRLFRAQQRLRADLVTRLREERRDLYELDQARSERIVARVLERMGAPAAKAE